MESQIYGTPVLGANIGGIPELIVPGVNGELFESGNKEDLKNKIIEMCSKRYSLDAVKYDSVDDYCKKLISIYEE